MLFRSAYQTAFLKANYPAEFWAANLTNEMNNPDKFAEYLQVAKDQGLDIMPPSINYSDKHFSVVGDKIVYGLAGIKNVGEGVVELFVAEREKNGPYKDFLDFLTRIDSRSSNSKLLESLIKAGAFDTMGVNRPTLLAHVADAVTYVQKRREERAFGQISLFDEEIEAQMDTFTMTEVEDWALNEKLETEKALLGFYISGHPMDAYKKAISERVTVNTARVETLPFGRVTNIIAMVTNIRPYTTKKGDVMAFLQLTDLNSTFDATLFPKSFEQYKEILHVDGIYGFTGNFDNSRGEGKISYLIEAIYANPEDLSPMAVTKCHIELEKSFCKPEQMTTLRDSFLTWEGGCKVELIIREGENPEKDVIACGGEFKVRYCDEFIEEVKNNRSVLNIWFD